MPERASRKVVSRRDRPAKVPLSRELIVSTALNMIEREGLDKLSLRRVAAALDTGAASLYVYLKNLDELHALMLDRALASVALPKDRNLHWRSKLKAYLLSYYRALDERQGLAQIALSTISSGINSLRIWETILDLLKQGGVDSDRASWGVDLLTLYIAATAAEQSNRRTNGMEFGRLKDTLSAVSPAEFPLVFASREALLSGNGNQRGEWALDVLIDGIVASRPIIVASPRKRR